MKHHPLCTIYSVLDLPCSCGADKMEKRTYGIHEIIILIFNPNFYKTDDIYNLSEQLIKLTECAVIPVPAEINNPSLALTTFLKKEVTS